MWVRKTAKECTVDRRKLWLAFGWPVIFAVMAFLCVVVVHMAGLYKAGVAPSRELTLGDILKSAGMLAIIVAIIGYLFQLWSGESIMFLEYPSNVQICDKCFRVKSSNGQQCCECGGNFDDFNNWKWIDD